MAEVSPPDAAIDPDSLVRDLVALARMASVGGAEDGALRLTRAIAARLGLPTEWHDEDLPALRRLSGYPGEEVERDALSTVTVRVPGRIPGAPRLVINGHIDVVPPGAGPWSNPPFEPVVRDGLVYGRGTADMKGGVVAALHALASVRAAGGPPGEVVLHVVAGEEDGGVGAFAALRRDADFAGCVIAEPTGGTVVCATAGALTFRVRVAGRAAHGSRRLDGVSAIDRYLRVHEALAGLERRLNADVTHPLMGALDLPYPLSVGKVSAGDWASTVPDELICEGRLGVPVGSSVDAVRAEFEQVVRDASAGGPPAEVSWGGGQFAPAETPPSDPLVALVTGEAATVTGVAAPVAGVPYGTDMRHYTAYGIPAVLYGPGSIEQAHTVDEYVPIVDLVTVARVLARVSARFGSGGTPWPGLAAAGPGSQ